VKRGDGREKRIVKNIRVNNVRKGIRINRLKKIRK
jgi:hypothetical protein